METSQRPRGPAPPHQFCELPAEVLVRIAKTVCFHERLNLALVCKRLYHATRIEGATLWRALPVMFYGRETLHSFQSWRERCICSPAILMLQQREPFHDGEDATEPARWEDVVQAYRCVAPTLTSLMLRFDGCITAGEWLREAEQLQDLALYGHRVVLTDALGMMAQLRELNLESTEELRICSPSGLPKGLTKLMAVDCQLGGVPEAVSRMDQLESLYLSRNSLRPASLAALAGLPHLRFISLIACGLQRPPRELSALTALRACYLDYNSLGYIDDSNDQLQESFSAALATHTGLQVLGMSHLYLDAFPDVLAALPSLKVLYLERNPGIVHLPNSAAAALARVRVFSCDCGVLFNNAAMFAGAVRLQHLLLSGSGLMCQALAAPVLDVLAVLNAMPKLERVTFVVQTQCEDVASVEVAQLMLRFAGACPKLSVDVLDSEQFFGLSLEALDALE